MSLNLVQLFKALGRRLGASLPEFARYQEARHFLGLERISRKTTIELRSFGNPKIDWIPIAEPISIFGTVFDEIDFSLWTANLRTRHFRQYFAAAASETVREMHGMLGGEEARVKAKVLLMGQQGKTRICRATGRCVEPGQTARGLT